ncbi:MAG: oxygenase MpaB family protein [Massilia sp.]
MSGPLQQNTPDIAQLRRSADPLADDTIARLLDPWQGDGHGHDTHACNFDILGVVNRQMEKWQINGPMKTWKADPDVDPAVAAELEAYVAKGLTLPTWADPERIERAEALFVDFGMLSCTLLFCSSLPECYVIPDLAAVLHVAGQLEERTEYRIRSTAAMIFPVMMVGGMTRDSGGGLPQILKVRLIHATIRHLILRGNPSNTVAAGIIPPLPIDLIASGSAMHKAMFARGWNLDADGMPCSQDELAYTLLTFGYVFLRSLRRLGLGLSRSDEQAYLHAWNVMGHVLGMQTTLMAHTMEQAEELFARLQEQGRARPFEPDSRPKLGNALMATMQAVIPLGLIKPFPVLLTRFLCGKTTASDIGIAHRVPFISRLLFVLLMALVRGFDWVVRLVLPNFSIARMITRVVGYQFTCKVLMDQTRPLKLPKTLVNQVTSMTADWHVDPKAPAWLNKLEHKLTRRPGAPAEGVKA